MFKITSATALIVGLLLAMPIIFAEAEAGRTADGVSVAPRADRVADNRIDSAFRMLDTCAALGTPGCRTARLGVTEGAPTITIEERDEARQLSTLVRMPAAPASAH